ncbi:MAG: hypothetical protein ACOC1G_05935 [Phycisphaeraceae bacterium]
MVALMDGQCGLCTHFGEHSQGQELVQIRTSKSADATLTEECGHPKHAELDLKVTPISTCSGFEPAVAA